MFERWFITKTTVASGALERHVLGDALLARFLGHGAGDSGVVDQPLDHVVATGELEGLDGTLEAGVEPRHHPLRPLADEPAHGGKQEVRQECHARKKQDQQ